MKVTRSVFATTKLATNAAILAAAILAAAGLANADAAPSAHWHKKGNLKISTPAEVGGAILQPGDYAVRELDSAGGHVVEFARLTVNPQVTEGLPIYDQEVVARVNCTLQTLNSKPRQTQLLFASNTSNVVGLEIRGDAVDFLF